MKILIEKNKKRNKTPTVGTIHCIIIPDKVHVLNTYTHEQHRGSTTFNSVYPNIRNQYSKYTKYKENTLVITTTMLT